MALIVDGNAHVLAPSAGSSVDSIESRPGQAQDPSAEGLLALMHAAGVDQALLVPHPPETFDNAYPIAAAQKYPAEFVSVAKLDVGAPGAAAAAERLLCQPG